MSDYKALAKAIYEIKVRRLLNPLEFITPLDHPNINQKAFLESKKKI